MMPERTGGAPSYVYPAFREQLARPVAKHANGLASWAYWLGWFPVAPLNMILASFYICDRFGLNTTSGFTPIDTLIAWWTLAIAVGRHPALLHPGLSRDPDRGALRDRARPALDDPADLPGGGLAVHRQRRLGPAVRLHSSSTAASFFTGLRRPRLVHGLHRLRVPAHLERARHGGGGLLHRRDARARARREDRDEPGGPLRPVHLHADPDRPSSACSARRRSRNPDLVDPNTMFVTFAGTAVQRRRRAAELAHRRAC